MSTGRKNKIPAISSGLDSRRGIAFARDAERTELTLLTVRHRLPFDIPQVWDAGKAVKLGHGPATVIGKTP